MDILSGGALKADIFEPYAASGVDAVSPDLRLAPNDELTPIDYGFVNLNADAAWFAAKGIPLPASLEDLTKPEYKGLLVAPNPATSSPGLAFLLATICHFGEDGFADYWKGLRANDVLITDGWNEAYFEHFTVGSAGKGGPSTGGKLFQQPACRRRLRAPMAVQSRPSVNLDLPGGAFRQARVRRRAAWCVSSRNWQSVSSITCSAHGSKRIFHSRCLSIPPILRQSSQKYSSTLPHRRQNRSRLTRRRLMLIVRAGYRHGRTQFCGRVARSPSKSPHARKWVRQGGCSRWGSPSCFCCRLVFWRSSMSTH